MRFLFSALMFGLVACTGKKDAPAAIVQTPVPAAHSLGELACYGYTTDGDTLRMQLRSADSQVTGSLYIHYNGKDRNEGTIVGQWQGDTLVADFKYISEGSTSVRQVAFLHRSGSFIEGFGPGNHAGHYTKFTATGQIIFSGDRVLEQMPCP